MIEFLHHLDAELLLFFNDMHCSFFDRFMIIFSGRWLWVPLYMTIFYALVKGLGLKKAIYFALLIGVIIAMSDQLSATVIRPLVARFRPANLDNPLSSVVHIVDGYRGGTYGFPSCHATNTFALATSVALIFRFRRLSIWMFVWAVLNCYSRLYLGVHYPGDLVVGALLGMLIAWAMLKIVMLSISIESEQEIARQVELIKNQAYYVNLTHPKPVDLVIWAIILTSVVIAVFSGFLS
jgi:undecaprenyl-diphosphatase